MLNANVTNGLSANNISMLQKYAVAPTQTSTVPVTTTAGTINVPIGTLPVISPSFTNSTSLVTSMDYNMSDKDQIRGRYIYYKQATLDTAAALPVFFTALTQPYDLITLAEYHQFSPSLTNEFRVGFNRTSNNYAVPNFKFSGLDSFPNITLKDLGGIDVGPDPNAPQFTVENTYSFVNNLSWTKGAHTLKFGVEGRKYIDPQLFIQRARGDYSYGSLSEYVNDLVPSVLAERSLGTLGYSGDQTGIYAFVNDTWKVRQNLSLNLGLRYEFNTTPAGWGQQTLNAISNTPGLITFGAPQAPKTDFMPRLGFAYSPGNSQNTSIRGGLGMGYDVLYDNIGTFGNSASEGLHRYCPGAPTCPTTGFLQNGGIAPTASSGITTYSAADAERTPPITSR